MASSTLRRAAANHTTPETTVADGRHAVALEVVRRALADLKYGQVAIIVQDGVVVQVDRTERNRLR